jgi:CD63 antigen
LSVIFVLELSAGITGYVLSSSTESLIKSTLAPTMVDYVNPNKTNIAVGWDNIQETYKCCGMDSYVDWVKAVNGTPLSCCEIPHATLDKFTCGGEQETLHKVGCVQAFGDFIRSHALSLGLAGVVLAAIQLIGLLFACLIARQIKKNRGFQ